MNSLSNIWNHPKTSAAGVLIAVITVSSVLSQQGITLGTVGSGSSVTLLSAFATALLGLLAKDPEETTSSTGSTAKLGAWALIALLLPLPFTTGCSGITVAQDIVNWTPTLQSAVAVINSTGAVLDPADAAISISATAGFNTASSVLVAQAKAYMATPNASALAQLQTAVVTFQQQVNTSLLSAARITNPNSQQKALTDINAVGTVVSTILALVETVSSRAAVKQMAAQSAIKLSQVQPYLNRTQAVSIVAQHYDEPLELAQIQVAGAELSAAHAGF
jgi:hypothetical protein